MNWSTKAQGVEDTENVARDKLGKTLWNHKGGKFYSISFVRCVKLRKNSTWRLAHRDLYLINNLVKISCTLAPESSGTTLWNNADKTKWLILNPCYSHFSHVELTNLPVFFLLRDVHFVIFPSGKLTIKCVTRMPLRELSGMARKSDLQKGGRRFTLQFLQLSTNSGERDRVPYRRWSPIRFQSFTTIKDPVKSITHNSSGATAREFKVQQNRALGLRMILLRERSFCAKEWTSKSDFLPDATNNKRWKAEIMK